MGTSSRWDLLEILSVDAISAHMAVATKTLANAAKWCFWDYIYNTGSNGGFPFWTHYCHHQLSPLMIFSLDLRKHKPGGGVLYNFFFSDKWSHLTRS